MLGEITLKDFIEQLGPKANFKKYIVSQCKDFEIIPRELTKMTPKAIMEMQNCILQERRESNEEDTEEWTEVEKKLVNWVLLCYLSHHHKTAMELVRPSSLRMTAIINYSHKSPLTNLCLCSSITSRAVLSNKKDPNGLRRKIASCIRYSQCKKSVMKITEIFASGHVERSFKRTFLERRSHSIQTGQDLQGEMVQLREPLFGQVVDLRGGSQPAEVCENSR